MKLVISASTVLWSKASKIYLSSNKNTQAKWSITHKAQNTVVTLGCPRHPTCCYCKFGSAKSLHLLVHNKLFRILLQESMPHAEKTKRQQQQKKPIRRIESKGRVRILKCYIHVSQLRNQSHRANCSSCWAWNILSALLPSSGDSGTTASVRKITIFYIKISSDENYPNHHYIIPLLRKITC